MNYLSSHNSSAYLWPNPNRYINCIVHRFSPEVQHPTTWMSHGIYHCLNFSMQGRSSIFDEKQMTNQKPDLLWDFVTYWVCVHFGSTPRRMHRVRLRITSGCWSDIRLRLTRVRLRTHLLWFAKKCQTHKQFLCFPKYRIPCGGKQNNGVSKPSFHTLLLHLRPQPERRAIKSRNPKIDANKSKKSRTM